jgi:hypothetical protein
VALPQCVSRDALLETRFSRHVPAHDRASRGSHVRPASRGFAPAPPSRLSEDPMGMIRPGKGARSDRPVPRAQREWRQSGGGGAGETTSGAEQIGIRPKHRHIDISYTMYASQYTKSHRQSRTHRHGTSSSGSALPPPCPTRHPKGLSDSSRLLSDTIPTAMTATTASTATAALDAPDRPHRDVTVT